MRSWGSSPLTRGKHRDSSARNRRAGLIPAHAGKTMHRMRSGSLCRAHPRSRGENAFQAAKNVATRGSSPLTRGKQRRASYAVRRPRLIPAHAGKTASSCQAHVDSAAHPRSRGENVEGLREECVHDGSSPLTRGKPWFTFADVMSARLIPAHAGKTTRGRSSRGVGRAHPRSRGENLALRCSAGTRGGSSPLTRGKPEIGERELSSPGLIPAHAGKTP